jgi:hypothetical protein
MRDRMIRELCNDTVNFIDFIFTGIYIWRGIFQELE